MDYRTLVSNLKSRKIAPVYFFYGEEKYAIDEAVKRVLEATVPPEVKDFNLDIFYGKESDSRRILDIATSYPMMAERRTVVIKEVQKLAATHLKNIAKYAESPTPTTCMVLVASAGNLRGKAYSSLKQHAATIEFKTLYDNQVPAWIKRYVNDHGREISVEAIQMLHIYVGNSLLNLVNELEKVFLNIGEGKRIEAVDVQNVVGLSKEFNIFNLLNAIGKKDLKGALFIVNQLLEHGESATGMIVRITNYFSTILKFLDPRNYRSSDRELAQKTKVNIFFVKDYRAQARNFTVKQIENAFSHLLEADLNLKTSYQTPKLIMELLIYKLVRN